MLYHVQVKFQKLESYKLSENVHIDKIMDHLFSSSSLTTSAPSTVRILNRSILDENPSNGLCGPLVEVELTFRLLAAAHLGLEQIYDAIILLLHKILLLVLLGRNIDQYDTESGFPPCKILDSFYCFLLNLFEGIRQTFCLLKRRNQKLC
ncbi:hypothetical protein CUMW_006370 [Citrus unshiu]|nr:hypothetical protein CUMW_006370 [Citrus unshiu]